MPICKNCKKRFPCKVIIDNKEVLIGKRLYCLECNPYRCRNFWKGKKVQAKDENGKRKLLKRKFVCEECGKTFIQKTRNKVCTGCRCKKSRHEKKQKALKLKGGKCLVCGYSCSVSLDFHHTNGLEKKFNLSSGWNKPWEKIEKEMQQCVLLCRNCHGEYHADLFCLMT